MRGSAEALISAIASIAILTLALYTIYTMYTVVITVYTSFNNTLKNRAADTVLRIINTSIYSNGTAFIHILNDGTSSLSDFRKLEVIIAIENQSQVYILRYSNTLRNLSWIPVYIYVQNVIYPLDRTSLKPGETLVIKAMIGEPIPINSTTEVIIITPNGFSTHRIYIVR